jgi:outer membrane receptor for ferrienterochelin and colicin
MDLARLFASASLAGFVLGAEPALAQAGAPESEAESGEAIIVTARRQEERLQDVPASVAVLTATTLERTGATNAQDFAQLTPGVTIVTGTAETGDTQVTSAASTARATRKARSRWWSTAYSRPTRRSSIRCKGRSGKSRS